MADNNSKLSTSTQIRNFYSEGMSSLGVRFYNTNLSFQFAAFVNKDANGRSTYNTQNALTTTVSFDGAFALYKASMDIVDGKEASKGIVLTVQCAGGASLILERRAGQNGQMETTFMISKGGVSVPFRFNTHNSQVNENGQMVSRVIESGLGMFAKTIEGYLTGINADRHLNKLTDDYVKSLGGDNNQGQQQGGQNGGYQGGGNRGGYNNNYRKPYNNNNNRRPYNNNYGNNNGQGSWNNQNQNQGQGPNQQNMSTYDLPK